MTRKTKLKNKILVDRLSKPTVQPERDQEIKWTKLKSTLSIRNLALQ